MLNNLKLYCSKGKQKALEIELRIKKSDLCANISREIIPCISLIISGEKYTFFVTYLS